MKKNKLILVFLIMDLCSSIGLISCKNSTSFTPLSDKDCIYENKPILYPKSVPNTNYKKGIIPDKETACRIAESYFYREYGENIYKERPYSVTLLNNGIWVVTTAYHEWQFGGDGYIELNKSDGKVIRLIFGK